MFRQIAEAERKIIRTKGKKCEAVGCDQDIEMIEVTEFHGGGADIPAYYCRYHAEREEEHN